MINTHPDVFEAFSLGIEDENLGEKLVSIVVLESRKKIDKLELLAFLRPLLMQNKLPKDIFFVDSIPKGLSGKVQINDVKKLIETNISKPTVNIDSRSHHIILASAAEAFGLSIDSLTMEDTAQNIDGWDSMAHLTFITLLEKHYDLRFSTSEMMTMNSMYATDRILKQKLSVR